MQNSESVKFNNIHRKSVKYRYLKKCKIIANVKN